MHRLVFPLTSLAPVAAFALLAPLALATTLTGCFSTVGPQAVGDDGGMGLDGTTAYDTSIPPTPPLMGDGGPCLPATSLPASEVPAYATVVQDVTACTSTQIAAFLAGCIGATSTASACAGFQTASANVGCMACLIPGTDGGPLSNTGGVLLDSTGSFMVGVNTPGCIALADPSAGPACAAVLEPLFQCELAACSSPDCRTADAGTYEGCLKTTLTDAGACQTQLAATTACDHEYDDGGAAVTACATSTQVLQRICGTGM